MPVSGFLSSIADKAQNALNQTPLAGHVPGTTADPAAHRPASQAGHRSFALESLQHQLRNIGQQYTSTTPVQRIITLEKGVALDFDALARDGKGQSKELYTWGQGEDADLTDVTDRLAFLNFAHGSLSGTLAGKLDGARSPLKALRDAEVALGPKRNIRTGLRNQIARIEHSPEKGAERRLAELKEQLSQADRNDEQLEKEIELLKRKAVRDSEQRKWEAIREYGEKLVLLSQAAIPIIGALPTLPPTTADPYTGAPITAAARASVQHALDDYKLGHVHLDVRVGADLSRSDTRSFGESHASELSRFAGQDPHPGLSLTPPIAEPVSADKGDGHVRLATEVDPEQGASVDGGSGAGVGAALEETGGRSSELASEGLAKMESAVEEKQRLEGEERVRVMTASSEVSESAEEEKKRLEREERERVLAGGASDGNGDKDGDQLPAYQDI